MSPFLKISEREHYAFIIVTALAKAYINKKTISLREIAALYRLSPGYIEEIAGALRVGGIITGARGRGGGSRLARAPKKITAADILRALEGSLAVAPCATGARVCNQAANCRSKNFWIFLQKTLEKALGKTTVCDLIAKHET